MLLFHAYFYFGKCALQIFIIPIYIFYIADEAKHNIDKLIDDLKHTVKLEASQDEFPNIVQILNSVMNVSETSIKGTMH